MKNIVELFEVQDVREESFEQSAEALALVESLGLVGQKQPEKDAQDTVVARFPYRLITNEELFIYSTLCPTRQDAHRYDDSPMPLEVLKTIAYAKSLRDPRLAYLEVWSAASSMVKDPILVAKAQSWGNDKMYILARWGEELLPLSVLLPDALKVWHAKRIDSLNRIKREVELALSLPCPMSAPASLAEPYFTS